MSDLDCARAEELLSDWIEGALDDVLRNDVAAHLERCHGCQELVVVIQDVVGTLRPQPQEPSADLAARAAQAAIRARTALPLTPVLPAWVPALAASLALCTTLGVVGVIGLGVGPARGFGERAVNATVYLTERKDRLVEDLHLLRVVLATMIEGRLDRVNDLVDDYRRRQRPRPPAPPAPQKTQNIRAADLVKTCEQPAAHRPVSQVADHSRGART